MHPELGSTTKIMPPPVTVHQFFRIHCLSVLKASDYSMHENQCQPTTRAVEKWGCQDLGSYRVGGKNDVGEDGFVNVNWNNHV